MLTLKHSVCILLKGFRKTSQCQLPTLLTCDLRQECIKPKLDIYSCNYCICTSTCVSTTAMINDYVIVYFLYYIIYSYCDTCSECMMYVVQTHGASAYKSHA